MTLRYKTLLVIGLVLGALFVVLYLTVSSILVSGFNKVEDQAARQNVFRVVEAFQGEIAGLDRTLGDWAPWDATYTFVQDANQEYVENNLDDETVANLGLNIMLFYNTANQLVFGKGLDLVEKTGTPLPESVGNALATSNYSLLSHTSTDSTKSGVLLLEEAPLMIASRPILTSERQGPIEGSLVMGRFVDKREVKALEDKTRLKINVFRLDSKDQPADIDEALTALSGAQPEPGSANPPVFNKPLNQDRMAGYTVEKSVFGQPVLLFRVDMARDVHAQGQTSLQAFIVSLLVVAVVFVAVTLLSLERLVLARVARLVGGVSEIGASGDISKRLTMPGKDELSGLAIAINGMLKDIQDSLNREKQLKREVEMLRIEIDQVKQSQQVEEITDTDYFRNLQNKAHQLRSGG